MALVGNCSWTTYSNHPTETTTETITYPENYVDSTLAGTTQTVEQPVQVETTTDYTDVYMCVKQIDNFNTWDGFNSNKNVLYQFAAYTDTATRNADAEDFLFWGTAMLQDYNPSESVYVQIYEELKAREGFTDLIDD